MSRRSRATGVLAALLLVTQLARAAPSISGEWVAPASGQPPDSQPARLSPEEAAIRLLPLVIATSDPAPGYSRRNVWVDVPTVRAYRDAGRAADPREVLTALLEQGHLVSLGQLLVPDDREAMPVASLWLWLMTTDAAAAAIAAGEIDAPEEHESVDIAGMPSTVAIRGAWHRVLPLSRIGLPDQEAYELRWQRGPLAFAITTVAAVGAGHLQTSLDLAAAIDARVAAHPAFDPDRPTTVAPASEAQRLDALLQIESLNLRALMPPPDYELLDTSLDIQHPAQSVVRAALGSGPLAGGAAALERFTVAWKRVMEVTATYVPRQGSAGPNFELAVIIDADADAAERDLRDLVVGPGTQVTTEAPPVILGDSTAAYRLTYPAGAGFDIGWRHGRVLFFLSAFGPPDYIDVEALVAFAQRVEAAYQASPLLLLDVVP